MEGILGENEFHGEMGGIMGRNGVYAEETRFRDNQHIEPVTYNLTPCLSTKNIGLFTV